MGKWSLGLLGFAPKSWNQGVKKALFGKKEEANYDASNTAFGEQQGAINDYAGFNIPAEAYTNKSIQRGVLDVARTKIGTEAKAARASFLNRFGPRIAKSGSALRAGAALEGEVATSAMDRMLGTRVALQNEDLALQRDYAGQRMGQLANVASMRGNYAGSMLQKDTADFQTRKAGEDKGLLSTFIAPIAGQVAGAAIGKYFFESGGKTRAKRFVVGENFKGRDKGHMNAEIVENPTGAPLTIRPIPRKAIDRFKKKPAARRRAA